MASIERKGKNVWRAHYRTPSGAQRTRPSTENSTRNGFSPRLRVRSTWVRSSTRLFRE